jgi:hypothetical protein
MRSFVRLLFLAPLLACETTPKAPDPGPDGEVTISDDELRPVRSFVLETRRVLAAHYVKIEATKQFFEPLMGYTRDPRYVHRQPVEIQADGTKVIILRNDNAQTSNIDPDLLPRVYFGAGGLQVRAYKEIRIYLREPRDRERPIFLSVEAKNEVGDARMWVSGRLQHAKPTLVLHSQLIWSPEKEEYIHRSSIG